ncbi:uncharacterized protein (DUF2336 family) [Skermanella aerolata]|jgi:uncharacterized protein (DUF2336 family)|uniref:DUF2336 domain-containing protein n=1 Tax=Skermanella aerolata TaxID=393310 RepID=UPI003D1A1B68
MTATATSSALSHSDVHRLLSDHSADARIETLTKLVSSLEGDTLAGPEREIATDILHRFAADAEAAVREAVAWQLHNSALLTDALATKLARDIGRVAFPVLRNTKRLSDEFLLQVIAERDAEKHMAIASRWNVSPRLADAIVETANIKVIACLLGNGGARIADPTLHKALDRYGHLSVVNKPMAERESLSLPVVEKLVAYVSEDIRSNLVERHHLSPVLVAELLKRGREAATMLLLKPLAGNLDELEVVVRHLDRDARLTPSLMLRALCAGDVELFTTGLAVRAKVATENARLLIWDDGPLGLRAIFEKARFPIALLPPFRVAIDVVKETGYDGGAGGTGDGRHDYQVMALARVFEDCGAIEDRLVDDLLLQLFDQKSDEVIDAAMTQAGMPFHPIRAVHR